jgi:formate dehydrogenase alpha subunit
MIKPDKIVSTVCPYCGVGCNLELHIKDNTIFSVTSPFDSPTNHGNLCVKGRFGYDFLYNSRRITTPLIRKEKQFAGKRKPAKDMSEWREASWDEALDLIADSMTTIYKRDGSDALGMFSCAKATNEENYLLQKLFRSLFRTNNIDHCTRLCHAGSVVALQMAVGSSAMSNPASDVSKNDVFIVTGSNTTETHPIIGLQMKAAIEQNGAKLIVIDPRRIEMVNFSTLWLQQQPGTDVAVFSALAHVILKEKLYNQKFIDDRTEGFTEFAASMEKFTPEYAEGISGVDRELIIHAARLYGEAKNAAIYWALGIPEHSHGTENALSLINLALLTGQIGREGTGLNPLRGQNNVQGASDSGAMPWHYPGYQLVDDEQNAFKFEKLWNVESGGLNRKRGLTNTEIIGAFGINGIKSMYIMGENPVMSDPNSTHVRHQFQQLEFFAAEDLFINETHAYADVILPAAGWAEKDGTFTNTDRRVQLVNKAVEPPDSARADWMIITDLAKRIESRLGRPKSTYWNYANPGEVIEEMGRVVPDYAGIRYHRLGRWGLQTPVPDENHPGTPFLFANNFPRRRGKFHPLEYQPPAEMPDTDYPFILTTGRVLEHWHGGTLTRASKLDNLYPQALMEVNPADAIKMELKEGDEVRVSSRRGSIVIRVTIKDKTRAGVVFIPFFFAEASANILTNDVIDPRAKIPEYKICAVKIDLINPPEEQAKLPKHSLRGRY